MKKLILSVMVMSSLAMAANAVTNMCVEQADGSMARYDVEKVKQVYFEEVSEPVADQGVTVSGTVGDYTYVDLGLSVKWATYNVGATKPTEYGDYFAWGETTPKEDYCWSTYKWTTDGGKTFTKYVALSMYGTVDNKTVLVSEDDAATANWGSGWRMPTRAEQDELREGCTWEWVENFKGGGVNGRLGTSMSNGNTIFLPAAGYRGGTDLYFVGSRGFYWSFSLSEGSSYSAYYLYFNDGYIDWSSSNRGSGQSVRAVTK